MAREGPTTVCRHSPREQCGEGLIAGTVEGYVSLAGGVVTDFDQDGMLDLILSHGESMAQPLSVFRGNQVCDGLDLPEGGWARERKRAAHSELPQAWRKPTSSQGGLCPLPTFVTHLSKSVLPGLLPCLSQLPLSIRPLFLSLSPCHPSPLWCPWLLLPSLQGFSNNWLRVVPRTRFGAFARGAKVVLYTKKSGAHLRIIDGGSGYLCEMEPVAHFGLGESVSGS